MEDCWMRKPESARSLHASSHARVQQITSKGGVKVAQYRVSLTPSTQTEFVPRRHLPIKADCTTHRKRPLKIHLVPRQLANHIMPYPRNFWRSIRAYPLLFLMGYHNRLSYDFKVKGPIKESPHWRRRGERDPRGANGSAPGRRYILAGITSFTRSKRAISTFHVDAMWGISGTTRPTPEKIQLRLPVFPNVIEKGPYK